MRADGRASDELRPIAITRNAFGAAPGRVFIEAGDTKVLCTASISEDLPPWKLRQDEPSGWVTAEYSMLPGATPTRKARDRGRVDGRTTEIQRLIGRSLRAVVDMKMLGPRMVTVDCDVLQADGGTRTLAITGGFVALVDAVCAEADPSCEAKRVFTDSVAAVSVGIVEGEPRLDLPYVEDSRAEVDFNVVMTGGGSFIEVQGTAERAPFDRGLLDAQLDLATRGIEQLAAKQREALGSRWPVAAADG